MQLHVKVVFSNHTLDTQQENWVNPNKAKNTEILSGNLDPCC